eukprot:206359_1
MSHESVMDLATYLSVFGALGCAIILIIQWGCWYVLNISCTWTVKWSFIAVSMLFLSCSAVAYRFVLVDCHEWPEGDGITRMMWGISWRFASLSVYILFTSRFQHAFGSTKYATSKPVLYTFMVLFIIYTLLQALHLFLFLIVYTFNRLNVDIYHIFAVMKSIMEQLIDLLLSVGLITLFCHRLWLLNMEIGTHQFIQCDILTDDDVDEDTNPSVTDCELKPKQVQIIKALSKLIVLSSTSIISTQCVMIYDIWLFYERVIYSDDYVDNTEREYMYFILGIVDCVINAVCILLSFDFAETWYRRVCGCLDHMLVNVISSRSRKQFKVNGLHDSFL